MSAPSPTPRKRPSSGATQVAMAMELPVIMIASIVIGGGAGYLLDRWLHTSPLLTLILGFLGFGAGVWDILRRLLHADKSNGGGDGGG
ncbi:MAG: AtpZ/AtpI family protein [Candidatus Acidiferrales bacterium]